MVEMADIGTKLHRIVSDYAAVAEHHRSGTPQGEATIEWFSEELRRLGARVQHQRYAFPRFEASWEVRIDGESVPSIPYFYGGSGRITTDRPLTGSMPVKTPEEMVGVYADLDASAQAAGVPATVMATLSECGELFAHNSPVRDPGPIAHLGVAGKLAGRLAASRVEVDFAASIVEGSSANVIGELGEGDPADTVLLTTSISGWFRCAGERGTGIALMLGLAEALSKEGPVRVLGTGNHELSHDGLHVYMGSDQPRPRAIMHFGGSSVTALPDPTGHGVILNPRFRVRAWAGDAHRETLERIFAPLERTVRIPTDAEHATSKEWQGESTGWSQWGVPLLSHGGRGPYTHTDHDVPELATAPSILAAVYAADLRAARFFAGLPGEGTPLQRRTGRR